MRAPWFPQPPPPPPSARVIAQDVLNTLSRGSVAVVRNSVLREVMLASGGEVMSRGMVLPILKRHLGAGVYRLWLEYV